MIGVIGVGTTATRPTARPRTGVLASADYASAGKKKNFHEFKIVQIFLVAIIVYLHTSEYDVNVMS